MGDTGTYFDPYPLDACPQCGGALGGPDDNLSRHCAECRVIVMPARVTWQFVEAGE